MFKKQMKNKGTSTLGLVITFGGAAIGMIIAWNAGLSVAIFNDHATLAYITASVGDIKNTVHKLDSKNTAFLNASSSEVYSDVSQ